MLKCLEKISHDFGCLSFRKWFLPLGDLVKELTASTQLHTEVNVLAVIVGFVVLDDVGVVHLLHEPDLVLETLEVLRIQFALINNLDSNFH